MSNCIIKKEVGSREAKREQRIKGNKTCVTCTWGQTGECFHPTYQRCQDWNLWRGHITGLSEKELLKGEKRNYTVSIKVKKSIFGNKLVLCYPDKRSRDDAVLAMESGYIEIEKSVKDNGNS